MSDTSEVKARTPENPGSAKLAADRMPLMRIEFALSTITAEALSIAKNQGVNFLVVEEWERILPKWEDGEDYLTYLKKRVTYSDDPLVNLIFLVNPELLPLITSSLRRLHWEREMNYHGFGYDVFRPSRDRSHYGLIRSFVDLGMPHRLLIGESVPKPLDCRKWPRRRPSEYPNCPNVGCKEPGRVGFNHLCLGSKHGGFDYRCYACNWEF